jgi:hypothetical protein
MKEYVIKIFTKELQTNFNIQSIDYLGKNDIEWEPNLLKYNAGFYITYEEVDNGGRQNVTVLEETKTRV